MKSSMPEKDLGLSLPNVMTMETALQFFIAGPRPVFPESTYKLVVHNPKRWKAHLMDLC